MNRNSNIDLIKIIACMGVVGLHTIGLSNYTLYYLCTFAVPMFYMVNGYLMFSKKEIGWKYASRKVIAYCRLILIWNLMIMIPIAILRHKFINPLYEGIRNVRQEGYLWHFWFFGAMIVINLLLPILYSFILKFKTIHYYLFAICIVVSILMTIYSWESSYPMQIFVPQSLRVWTIFTYFLFGGLPLIKKIKYSRITFISLGSVLILLTYISNCGQKHLGNYIYHNRMAEYFYDEITVMIWCFVLFIFLMIFPVDKIVRRNEFLTRISGMTLGIFIIHPLVIKAVELLFSKAGMQDSTGILELFIKYVLVFLISAIIIWLIEQIKYFNKLVKL